MRESEEARCSVRADGEKEEREGGRERVMAERETQSGEVNVSTVV